MRSSILISRVRWPIVFFILILPIYFKIPADLQLPLLGFISCLFILFKSTLRDAEGLKLILFYSAFAIGQIAFAPIVNYAAFARKLAGILIFVGTFSVYLNHYSQKYDKYYYISLSFVIAYAVYSAPSYILGYQSYLIPGTCGITNLSELGHLRCATFGEGNYFGGYLALLILIFANSPKFMALAFIGVVISWSPTSILVFAYCSCRVISRRIITGQNRSLMAGGVILFILILSIALKYQDIFEIFSNASDRSSLGERSEFIRSALAMWIDYPLAGVGFGNFGYNLADYTVLSQLFERTIFEESRFIPNSNIAEFLSEQGLIGFCFYIYILRLVSNIDHPIFGRIEIIFLLLFIGIAMPTFFQIIVAALLGTLASKYRYHAKRQ